jgi:hypothetical protein
MCFFITLFSPSRGLDFGDTLTQKSINQEANSYALKHKVERWAKKYVSNGDFIQAALLNGYWFGQDIGGYRLTDNEGYDAFFCMEIIPEKDWQRVKPSNFSKWLFSQVDDYFSDAGELAYIAVNDSEWPRRSKRFYDYWVHLKNRKISGETMGKFLSAWRQYSGEEPPYPDETVLTNCERVYSEECDIVKFGEKYQQAPRDQIYIYVLFEEGVFPKVKYVGRTKSPSQRLKQHILNPGNLEKLAWVGKLVNDEKFPCLGIVDLVPKSEASRMEQTYVNAFVDLEREIDQDINDVLLNKSLL